jgi:osmotically-inducible protein OsmY
MKRIVSLAVIGLGARWLADSERRAAVLARLRGIVDGGGALAGAGDTTRGLAHQARATAERAAGAVAEATAIQPTNETAALAGNPDDARLHDRVESELFRGEEVPKGSVNVNVEFGKVVLRGQVESRELIDDLVARARAIDGVNDVESLLHLPDEPAPMHE